MVAIVTHEILARSSEHLSHLVKRKNWAAKNPGVVLVFCIIFVVVVLVGGLLGYRKLQARKAAKPAKHTAV